MTIDSVPGDPFYWNEAVRMTQWEKPVLKIVGVHAQDVDPSGDGAVADKQTERQAKFKKVQTRRRRAISVLASRWSKERRPEPQR